MSSDNKGFWERQSKNYNTAFEQTEPYVKYLEKTERRRLFQVLDVHPEMTVLDLGCGTGRWAFEFAQRCQKVVAVDFAEGMIERTRREAEKRGFRNMDFHVAPVQEFITHDRFDLIIISGVLVYFEDDELSSVIPNIKSLLTSDGKIVSRETVGIAKRLDFQQEHQKIGEEYAAAYRTAEELKKMFEASGLSRRFAGDFAPVNFPMIFYRKFIPGSLKNTRSVLAILNFLLKIQLLFDPILLRFPVLYRPILHKFWKIKSMLFVYGID